MMAKKQVSKYGNPKARRKTAKKRALGKQGDLDNLRGAFSGASKIIK